MPPGRVLPSQEGCMGSKKPSLLAMCALVLAACGQSNINTSGATVGTATPIGVVVEVTSALQPTRHITATNVRAPTANPEPIVEGNSITINADARLYKQLPPIQVRIGQEIHVTPFSMPAWAYSIEYDTTMLTPGAQTNFRNPDSHGWVWTASKEGATSIVISEELQPCANCGAGRPSRTLYVDLVVGP
jgi:hypothetical protein